MILQNVSLKNYNTFKIGGNAKYFAETDNAEEIIDLLEKYEKVFILGNGSNVLFSDDGFDGLVLKVGKKSLHTVIQEAANNNLGGIEKLEGIPASLGGAIYMNAGAHGQQISDCIKTVTSIKNGKIITRTKQECQFAYRTSIFKKSGESEVILSAEFDFIPMDKEMINKNRKEVLKWRKEKQPLNFPNAGSIFKNPTPPSAHTPSACGCHPSKRGEFLSSNILHSPFPSAGALIESCGLKGFSVGDAQVSELHANFIINKGNATAKDVKSLISYIKNEVLKQKNVHLSPEIVIL